MKQKLLLLSVCLCYFLSAHSQKVSDFNIYASKYKDRDIVYLNVKTEITVDIVKNEIKISETKSDETYYNNYKAGAFSETKINSSQFSKLKEIEACTLIPEKEKFKELKVKDFKTKEVLDEDIFYQDLYATSFIYPSLQQGAITRLKYTLEINDPHFFPTDIVKQYYPIENYEFVINTDKNVEIEIKYFNTESEKIDFTKEEKGGRVIYSWKAKNIVPYKSEDHAPDFMCFLPQIIPFIKSYITKDSVVNVFRNVNDLFSWANQNLSTINHKHTDEMISTVTDLVKDCKTDFEKVNAVYLWVQNNIKYVANEYGQGGFTPRDPYQIFEKRYGDCKDMATIIVELLDIANIKAYFAWIGTRDLPFKYEEVPTSIVDNHMVAVYNNNGKYIILDATNHYVPIGLPSSFIQGKETMIRLSDTKYDIYTVPEVLYDINAYRDTVNISINKGKIEGKGSLQLSGYYYSNMRDNIENIKDANEKTTFMRSYLEKGNNKCVIDKYDIITSPNNLCINYEFNLANHIVVTENELFLNLNLSQPYDNFELFKDERQLDYEFYYKSALYITNVLNLPEGYEVSYIPNNTKFENEKFSYSISYETKGNQIIYHFSSKTNILLLKPFQFADWNKMLKQLRSDFKESIALKKKI
ncbi:MAG: DUF3857 domain-containing protein [Bacteroidota bacterium]